MSFVPDEGCHHCHMVALAIEELDAGIPPADRVEWRRLMRLHLAALAEREMAEKEPDADHLDHLAAQCEALAELEKCP